ncbi:hypothetical protein DFH28DRAFT_957648 [Melampsora americana]|nr:hypothetical protein DFH28DRAFT_957648 [Melampsora americana]
MVNFRQAMVLETFEDISYSKEQESKSTHVKRDGLLGLGLDVGVNLGADKQPESHGPRGTTPTPQPITRTPIANPKPQPPSSAGPPAAGAKSEQTGKAGTGSKAPVAPSTGEPPPVSNTAHGSGPETPKKAGPNDKTPGASPANEPPPRNPVVENRPGPQQKTGSSNKSPNGPSVDAPPTSDNHPNPKPPPTPASRPISHPAPHSATSTNGEIGEGIRGSDIHTPFSQPKETSPEVNRTSFDSVPNSIPPLPPGSSKTTIQSHNTSNSHKELATTLKIVLPILGSLGALYILWTIIRKWKLRPSRKFEARLDEYGVFEPRPPSFVEKSYDRHHPYRSGSYSGSHSEHVSSAGHSNYHNDGIQGSGGSRTPTENSYGNTKDGHENHRYFPQKTLTLSPRQGPLDGFSVQQLVYPDSHMKPQPPPPVFTSDLHIPSWYQKGVGSHTSR